MALTFLANRSWSDDGWRRPAPDRRGYRHDAFAAALLFAGAALSAFLYDRIDIFGDGTAEWWVTAAWLPVISLPLAARRRWPEAVALVVGAAFIVGQLLSVPEMLFNNIALFMALYSVGAWSRHRGVAVLTRAVVIAAMFIWLVVAMVWASAIYAVEHPERQVGFISEEVAYNGITLITNLLYFGASYYFGEAMYRSARQRDLLRQRTEQLQVERENSAEQAVALERLRIARELHDVVAHHVSLMGIQAAAARRQMSRDTAAAAETLGGVESTARQAVEELHRLLHTLREDDTATSSAASTLGLDRLDELIQDAHLAGLDVRRTTVGEERPLAATVAVAAYRIVQEALTNTRKHAGAVTTDLRLRYLDDVLEVEVSHDGAARRAPVVPGSGLGIAGMHERAAAVGGSVEAGPKPRGGWRVRARFPYPASPCAPRREDASAPSARLVEGSPA